MIACHCLANLCSVQCLASAIAIIQVNDPAGALENIMQNPVQLLHIDRLFHRERKREAPANVNELHEQQLGMQDRVALWITSAVGTMYCVYFFGVVMAIWMFWQWRMEGKAFDPYPFAFLLFLGNIIQLLLMPLIMVGQNIQGRHNELKADEQFKTTMASYQDAEHIIEHLAALDAELIRHRDMLAQIAANTGSKEVVSAQTQFNP